jgi:DNA polymerase type B, organellar and viral
MQTTAKRAEIAAALSEARNRHRFAARPDLTRKDRKRGAKAKRLHAYDLETTRIQVGTPRPLYVTAYSPAFQLQSPIRDMAHLTAILRTQFLTPENLGSAFVAWNGNRFDAYFIAAALIRETDLVLVPYLTRSKALRGLRVVMAEDKDKKNARSWEFLCGIAMTGLVGTTLEKFVANFAPEFPKLTGTIDFEKETFDHTNPQHCAYAMRDSEGLYHAITHAQEIMMQTFNQPLAVTMGGACIKILQAHIPRDTTIESMTPDLRDVFSRYVMRGGFCYCAKRYSGPVWKYDINQAYAAAMRVAELPRGGALHFPGKPPEKARVYVARLTAKNPRNRIPFYYRTCDELGRIRSRFDFTEITETWLTSIEVDQLRAEGWQINITESHVWPGSFNLAEYVDKLETLRAKAPGGPSGPQGTMIKNTGNHSYGKTVEQIEPIEFILAAECPPDAVPWYGDGADPIEHIYYRIDDDRRPKDYHQPQLGAWITAHVRMVLRRATLVDPAAWLYADTDCVIFSRDVTAELDIDPKRYGAWKIEEEGTHYQIIAKKVYTQVGTDKPKKSAKGLHVKKLTPQDFSEWYDGKPPVQDQDQLNSFLAVMHGAEMYRNQTRQGTRIEVIT